MQTRIVFNGKYYRVQVKKFLFWFNDRYFDDIRMNDYYSYESACMRKKDIEKIEEDKRLRKAKYYPIIHLTKEMNDLPKTTKEKLKIDGTLSLGNIYSGIMSGADTKNKEEKNKKKHNKK